MNRIRKFDKIPGKIRKMKKEKVHELQSWTELVKLSRRDATSAQTNSVDFCVAWWREFATEGLDDVQWQAGNCCYGGCLGYEDPREHELSVEVLVKDDERDHVESQWQGLEKSDYMNVCWKKRVTCAKSIAQCHVCTVIATMMSSVTMRAENEIETTWMKSASNTRRAPYIITAPRVHIIDGKVTLYFILPW